MRKRIYVTGPINRSNEYTLRTSQINLSILCRRIILLGHVPYCLVTQVDDYLQDSRLTKVPGSWIESMCAPVMDLCEILCYIPEMAAMPDPITSTEKDLWRISGKRMVTADVITKFLIEGREGMFYGRS